MMISNRAPFRISIENKQRALLIKVEGKLANPFVDELRRVWYSLSGSLGAKELEVDLQEVSFIDASGIDLLAEMCGTAGAELRANTPLIKYFAEQAMRKSTQHGMAKGAF